MKYVLAVLMLLVLVASEVLGYLQKPFQWPRRRLLRANLRITRALLRAAGKDPAELMGPGNAPYSPLYENILVMRCQGCRARVAVADLQASRALCIPCSDDEYQEWQRREGVSAGGPDGPHVVVMPLHVGVAEAAECSECGRKLSAGTAAIPADCKPVCPPCAEGDKSDGFPGFAPG